MLRASILPFAELIICCYEFELENVGELIGDFHLITMQSSQLGLVFICATLFFFDVERWFHTTNVSSSLCHS